MGRDSFHWQLGQARDQLFRDEDFAALHGLDNGCPSVSPRLLVTALWLQAYDKESDVEAQRRARLDLSWKVTLGMEADAVPFAQSMLQHFRAQLILYYRIQAVFLRSLKLAEERGLLRSWHLCLVRDTSPILGRGVVQVVLLDVPDLAGVPLRRVSVIDGPQSRRHHWPLTLPWSFSADSRSPIHHAGSSPCRNPRRP